MALALESLEMFDVLTGDVVPPWLEERDCIVLYREEEPNKFADAGNRIAVDSVAIEDITEYTYPELAHAIVRNEAVAYVPEDGETFVLVGMRTRS